MAFRLLICDTAPQWYKAGQIPMNRRAVLTPEQLEDPCPRCGHKLWLHTPACVGARPQGAIRPGPMDSVPCPCEGP